MQETVLKLLPKERKKRDIIRAILDSCAKRARGRHAGVVRRTEREGRN